jgi:hypothetical protein
LGNYDRTCIPERIWDETWLGPAKYISNSLPYFLILRSVYWPSPTAARAVAAAEAVAKAAAKAVAAAGAVAKAAARAVAKAVAKAEASAVAKAV